MIVYTITGSTDNVPSVHSNSGQIIERQLFIERVHHLLQCGAYFPKEECITGLELNKH